MNDDDRKRGELFAKDLQNLPQKVAALVAVDAQQHQDFTAQLSEFNTHMDREIALIKEGFTAGRGESS